MRLKRLRILITGQVQGVGFRPHVYRTACHLELTGWVRNNGSGVLIEIQGQAANYFQSKLLTDLPPLAVINTVQTTTISTQKNENSFQILESQLGLVRTIIPPDIAICTDCLHELFDPKSHYYLYPFLNCTHCGPRLSITRDLPYDRCQTSMAIFPLCDACLHDYTQSTDRRYHAQPTACGNCGPQLKLSLADIAKSILEGEIIALKGLGGYQLICDAKNENTLIKLRARKNRDAKPLALMVVNCKSASNIAELTACTENLLKSKESPIVLLPKNNKSLSDIIAPNLSHYGVMLPSTPLHYLLFHALAGFPEGYEWLDEFNSTLLVVTSANRSGHPLIYDDLVAKNELGQIADKIVSHNRQIVCAVDDSVVHVINETPFFIRRSRGFVPKCIKLPYAIPPTLALGGHLKNTFCLTRDDEAFISPHIGNLDNKASIEFFHEALNYFINFLSIKPQCVAHDMHPDFYTTRLAQEYGIPAFAVQHHHAHLAAVAAEHCIDEPALGLALDGYGYGINGGSWGGELLLLENTIFQRLGCFYPLPQPGGNNAAKEPWRMAAGVLHVLGRGCEIPDRFHDYPHAVALPNMLEKNINSPLTSSCGRLFDAASAILGVNRISHYEGQAAMQLESLVTSTEILTRGWHIEQEYFNMLPTLTYLFNLDPITGANIFHGTLIAGLAEWVLLSAERIAIDVVLLSGGCFLNKVLTEGLIKILSKQGLKVFLSEKIPPNDGGISLGQAWIAGRLQDKGLFN